MATERLDLVRSRERERAVRCGINPRDVDVLLSDILGKPLAYVIGRGETLIDPRPLELMLERRFKGEPLQYIRGRTDFFSREFLVDDRVLIPRPETELLVEAAIARAPDRGRAIDIGTGSGCVAITLALSSPGLEVFSVDVSVAAIALATENRRLHHAHVRFAASDVLTGVRGSFDLVVSNPPYIPQQEYQHLAPEVRDHEPRIALTPGPAGTEIIGRILAEAKTLFRRGGRLLFEIGFGQEPAVRELARQHGYTVEAVIPDLAGIPRIVVSSAHV